MAFLTLGMKKQVTDKMRDIKNFTSLYGTLLHTSVLIESNSYIMKGKSINTFTTTLPICGSITVTKAAKGLTYSQIDPSGSTHSLSFQGLLSLSANVTSMSKDLLSKFESVDQHLGNIAVQLTHGLEDNLKLFKNEEERLFNKKKYLDELEDKLQPSLSKLNVEYKKLLIEKDKSDDLLKFSLKANLFMIFMLSTYSLYLTLGK